MTNGPVTRVRLCSLGTRHTLVPSAPALTACIVRRTSLNPRPGTLHSAAQTVRLWPRTGSTCSSAPYASYALPIALWCTASLPAGILSAAHLTLFTTWALNHARSSGGAAVVGGGAGGVGALPARALQPRPSCCRASTTAAAPQLPLAGMHVALIQTCRSTGPAKCRRRAG